MIYSVLENAGPTLKRDRWYTTRFRKQETNVHVAPLRGKKTEFKEKPHYIEMGKEKVREIVKVELIKHNQKDKKENKKGRVMKVKDSFTRKEIVKRIYFFKVVS